MFGFAGGRTSVNRIVKGHYHRILTFLQVDIRLGENPKIANRLDLSQPHLHYVFRRIDSFDQTGVARPVGIDRPAAFLAPLGKNTLCARQHADFILGLPGRGYQAGNKSDNPSSLAH